MRFPIFPLNGAVLFPETNLPLNIFEKRYIQMIDYALSNKRLLGMIQTDDKHMFFKIGCLGRITNFSETQDGRYQINLEGLERFKFNKIVKTDFNFKIIEGDVLDFEKNLTNEEILNYEILTTFKKYLKEKKIDFNTDVLEKLDASSLIKIICVLSPLSNMVKQMLLEFNNEKELCKNLLSVLEVEMKDSNIDVKFN